MKVLLSVIKSKKGLFAIAEMIAGSLIIAFLGNIINSAGAADLIILAGSIISIIGTQRLISLIIATRNAQEYKKGN